MDLTRGSVENDSVEQLPSFVERLLPHLPDDLHRDHRMNIWRPCSRLDPLLEGLMLLSLLDLLFSKRLDRRREQAFPLLIHPPLARGMMLLLLPSELRWYEIPVIEGSWFVFEDDESVETVRGGDGEREELVAFEGELNAVDEAELFDHVPTLPSFRCNDEDSPVRVEEGGEI